MGRREGRVREGKGEGRTMTGRRRGEEERRGRGKRKGKGRREGKLILPP